MSSLFSLPLTRFARSRLQFLLSIGDANRFAINLEDEVVRRSIITYEGETLWPAPAPAITPQSSAAAQRPVEKIQDPVVALTPWQESVRSIAVTTGGMGTALALGKLTGPAFMNLFTVLGLAGIVGFRAVWSVTPALHSPLMCECRVSTEEGRC